MLTNDIVAQDEDHHDHISTNLFWARRGLEMAKLWERILNLERDGAEAELSRMNKVSAIIRRVTVAAVVIEADHCFLASAARVEPLAALEAGRGSEQAQRVQVASRVAGPRPGP